MTAVQGKVRVSGLIVIPVNCAPKNIRIYLGLGEFKATSELVNASAGEAEKR